MCLQVVGAAETLLPQGGTTTLQAKCHFAKQKPPAVHHMDVGVTLVLRLHLDEPLTVGVTITVPHRQGEITAHLANPSFVNLNQLCL